MLKRRLTRGVCGNWLRGTRYFARMMDCFLKDPSGLDG